MVPPDHQALTRRCSTLIYNVGWDYEPTSSHYRDDNGNNDGDDGDNDGGSDNDKYT